SRTSMPINAESGNPLQRISYQPTVAGPAGQLVAAGELELTQHRRHVGLDRLHRQVQAARDLLVGEPAGDVAQDLPPAGGELVQLRVDPTGEVAVEGIEHEPGQAGGEHGVAALDPADGGGQVGWGDGLGDVPAGPGPDHADHVLGRVRYRQGQE